ncbi:Zeta-crystallin [Drechslerella dactyloides]|uniref:Zeta-crystallin n=1 Tax=Drechslerella dactyloides TaxID=74499 RepID=A0AAD6J4T3_DREDA|nr:Zeta-crystallin [Drechslerella dactyloides]
MKAVGIKGDKGPATSLFIDEIPEPPVSEGEVLVKIRAFGLNRMDLSQREGHYPVPTGAPKTLGVEFSGVIEKIHGDASEVDSFKIGDEVFGLAYGGAYAEKIAVSAKMIIHKPAKMSFEEAAGVPEAWITATQALFLVGCFKKGDRVLLHAGASAVSLAAIQLAKHAGASEIYVTASSQEKIDFCIQLGATAGFNYKTQDFGDEILKATDGKGVDLIVDYIVGQGYLEKDIKCAAFDCRVVLLALLGGFKTQEPIDIASILRKRVRIEGSTLRSRTLEYQKTLRDRLVQEAMPKFEEDSFQLFIEKVFSWKDIIQAHQLMESNQTKGKIICVID